mmetsp:Transcript_6310/g.15722  ORF Transcript_6310/g.15722 Transcript_6310/m.15722 type:complete len:264 (-) Transcript_6310:67-858(-)
MFSGGAVEGVRTSRGAATAPTTSSLGAGNCVISMAPCSFKHAHVATSSPRNTCSGSVHVDTRASSDSRTPGSVNVWKFFVRDAFSLMCSAVAPLSMQSLSLGASSRVHRGRLLPSAPPRRRLLPETTPRSLKRAMFSAASEVTTTMVFSTRTFVFLSFFSGAGGGRGAGGRDGARRAPAFSLFFLDWSFFACIASAAAFRWRSPTPLSFRSPLPFLWNAPTFAARRPSSHGLLLEAVLEPKRSSNCTRSAWVLVKGGLTEAVA